MTEKHKKLDGSKKQLVEKVFELDSGLKMGGRPDNHTNLSENRNWLVYFVRTCLQVSQYLPRVVQHAMLIHYLRNYVRKKHREHVVLPVPGYPWFSFSYS